MNAWAFFFLVILPLAVIVLSLVVSRRIREEEP